MSRNEPPRLIVGDKCVLLIDSCLYDVTVSEVRVCCEGDPLEFAMYRVKSRETLNYFERHSQHRADLFKLPSERPLLIARVEQEIESLQDLLHAQQEELENDDETTQMERAADTAQEPRR